MTTEVFVESASSIIVQIVDDSLSKTIEVNSIGIQGPAGLGHMFKQELRTITLAEETAKKIVLNMTAVADSLMLFNVEGGLLQFRGSGWQFLPAENAITWSGLGLDSLIAKDDRVEIIYLPVL